MHWLQTLGLWALFPLHGKVKWVCIVVCISTLAKRLIHLVHSCCMFYKVIRSCNILMWLLCLLQMFFVCGESFWAWAESIHWGQLRQSLHSGARGSPRPWLLSRAFPIRQRRLRGNCLRKHPIRFSYKYSNFREKKKKKYCFFLKDTSFLNSTSPMSWQCKKWFIYLSIFTCNLQEKKTILEKLTKLTAPPVGFHMTTCQWCTILKPPSVKEMDPQ